MSSVLIVGANGLLGQKLIRLYSQFDINVIASARSKPQFELAKNIVFRKLDICDSDACLNVVNECKPQAIINAAAMTQVDLCEDETERCDSI